jgi:hypothetical protein
MLKLYQTDRTTDKLQYTRTSVSDDINSFQIPLFEEDAVNLLEGITASFQYDRLCIGLDVASEVTWTIDTWIDQDEAIVIGSRKNRVVCRCHG